MSRSALAEAAGVYQLDSSTDRLLVREDLLPSMLANRQYAALLGKRAMAIAMPLGEGGKDRFILIPRGDSSGAAGACRLRPPAAGTPRALRHTVHGYANQTLFMKRKPSTNSDHDLKPAATPPLHRAMSGLGFAALLGLALLLLSYLRLAGLLKTDAFHGTRIIAETLTEPLWKTQLGLNILLFAVAQFALHLGFAALCWVLAVASGLRVAAGQAHAPPVGAGVVPARRVVAAGHQRQPLSRALRWVRPTKAIGHVSLLGVSPYVLMGIAVAVGAVVTVVVALLRKFDSGASAGAGRWSAGAGRRSGTTAAPRHHG